MAALLTPYDRGDAIELGKLWRKQVLPIGRISYKGRVIDFTREYLTELAANFKARAYDQVPFQLAPDDNSHSNDPDRYRGEIAGVELTADGLDVLVSTTEDGDALLRKNPRLGVSARIVEDYDRADGKHFRHALQHVLGTLDPRLTGMRPWEAIEASNEDGDVTDLTALEFIQGVTEPHERPAQRTASQPSPATQAPDTEDTNMARTEAQEARLAKLLDLPDDQFEALIAPKPAAGEDGGEDEDGSGISDEEIAALIDDSVSEDGSEDGAEPELVTAGAELSAEQQTALELANERAERNETELRRITAQLNATTFEKERDHFAAQGIPARLVDLARPLLEGAGRTIDLSNGKTANDGAIVRKLLTEFGGITKQLGLSVELGNSEGADTTAVDEAREAEERAKFVTRYLASNSLR